MLFCCAVFLAACAPSDDFVVDFSDGNTDFLTLNLSAIDADRDASFEVAAIDDSSALRLTAPSGGRIHLGINVDGLLGERAVDVQTAVFEVYAEFPDGRFAAQTGEITAFMGGLDESDSQPWTVYLDTRNPNKGIFTFDGDSGFVAGEPNIFEFVRLIDRATEPAIIYIKSITFFDSDNYAIPVDTTAGWAGPPGYAAPIVLDRFNLPVPPPLGNPTGWMEWGTYGTDDLSENYIPWEILASSINIVFEFDEAPGSLEVVWFGAGNNWSWQQHQVANFWDAEQGVLRVNWGDIGLDTGIITEEDAAFKIAIWYNALDNARAVYLEYINFDS